VAPAPFGRGAGLPSLGSASGEEKITVDVEPVRPGHAFRLDRQDPADTSAFRGSKDDAVAATQKLLERLESLQELLYASRQRGLLVVLQGLDTAGKDGTIRRVFEGVNPEGVRVAQFRQPTPLEADHDFLWRVHPCVPARGEMVIFNRSHYEDVLAARVDRTVPKKIWKTRYDAINGFERMLTNEGTTVLKFFLHISAKEQRKRLKERLADPTKHWKFSRADLAERPRWPQYVPAIDEMIRRTSTARAPWYVVPANKKWFRDWTVASVLVATLEGFHLQWPPLPKGLRSVRIPR
jgi:PPK2 family polyphosphate:nucleotide phosphotransferase